jgi:transcriptional regulator with XRE-family HTH domain
MAGSRIGRSSSHISAQRTTQRGQSAYGDWALRRYRSYAEALLPFESARTYAPRIAETHPDWTAPRIREAIGAALRTARRRRGLTLREVAGLSEWRFKPSALGGYERGERAISLERFSALASLYGIPPDLLLREVLDHAFPEQRVGVVLDLSRLELLPGEESRLTAELAENVATQRGQTRAERLALRSADVRALALRTRLSPTDLLRRLEPALLPAERSNGS